MKTLLIMRHAKSSWDDASLDDFDRPLNDRGRGAAPFMGRLLREKGLVPQIVIASPARRARETAELVREALGSEVEIRFDERIYEAAVGTLAEVVSEIGDDFDRAMLVGHNPGFEGIVRHLTGELEAMPTAAVAVVEIASDSWREAAGGRLAAVYRPKDEMKN
jgi:phosphohistidine phosphatase